MDRETRKNHPDEVFRIQFDEGEKGKGKEAGSSVEDFHSHRFLRRLIVPFTRTERSRVWYLKMSGVSFSPFFLSFSRMSLGLRMTHTRSYKYSVRSSQLFRYVIPLSVLNNTIG